MDWRSLASQLKLQVAHQRWRVVCMCVLGSMPHRGTTHTVDSAACHHEWEVVCRQCLVETWAFVLGSMPPCRSVISSTAGACSAGE